MSPRSIEGTSRWDFLAAHRAFLSDHVAQEAYRKALSSTLRGGETVLDLGTGTGIHAVFACHAGAKHVYAVDEDGIIELAREIAVANGCADRITFLHGRAEDLELSERVDLVVTHQSVSRLLTLLPLARARFLKKGGGLVPRSVDLFVAPVEASEMYEAHVAYWERPHHGVDFGRARTRAVNSMHGWHASSEQLLAQPIQIARMNLISGPPARLAETAEAAVTCRGRLHGVGLWCAEWLTDAIGMFALPPAVPPTSLWLSWFLPIEAPIAVEPGDRTRIIVQTSAGDWETWSWDVSVFDRSGSEKMRCRQSTIHGRPLTREIFRLSPAATDTPAK